MSILTATKTKSFIEAQFPVSKVSKESYKERKAVSGQTLTGLGKWWGRKPLVMIRAALIGLLMPCSDDLQKDLAILFWIMTMDDDGLWRRKKKTIPYKKVYALLTEEERRRYFRPVEDGKRPKLKRASREEKRAMRDTVQRLAFERLSYDEKLDYCDRPEQIDGPSEEAWTEINAHLGTSAGSPPELVQELGKRQFGGIPRVGDAFCGGGSVPFEAARLGCNAYGSDLNPVAALLTWASLNIMGGGKEVASQVQAVQQEVYQAVDKQITKWGIEHNSEGWRADAYLYCVETRCPECGVMVPLAPSWVIATKTNVIAELELNEAEKRFDIEIKEGVSKPEYNAAKNGTVSRNSLDCPACGKSTPIRMIRGDRRTSDGAQYGLRLWEREDIVPRSTDTFQERLYCVRWEEAYLDEEGKQQTRRHYKGVTDGDLVREAKVLRLLNDRFTEWQQKGYLPNREIESGYNTDQPIREKGWTHWHHLFNPRQLLLIGEFNRRVLTVGKSQEGRVALLLLVGRLIDWNSKLCVWLPSQGGGIGGGKNTFLNQALNTNFNFSTRPFLTTKSLMIPKHIETVPGSGTVKPVDARGNIPACDIWLTDPPYADAINYDQLAEFYLAWYEKHLESLYPAWYTDSKRVLAITGSDEDFRRDMVDCYHNLAEHMPDDGVQIVMFTHQDVGVWADLALILWAAGLRVTAAWTIATETDSALKQGNYVQGTVLLVLRKRKTDQTAFTDQITVQIEDEVRAQLDAMQALDEDEDEPSFGDTDYQLAAYAAALRVLTQYSNIEEWDIERELARPRQSGETSPIEVVIEHAVQIACDHLIPQGFDSFIWKTLSPEERLYLKGLELESHSEFRTGAYQELARGFGVREYTHLFASKRANKSRFKNATEFGTKQLGGEGFNSSHVRHALFAVREARRTDDAQMGRNWLKNEVAGYWTHRKKLIEILEYFAAMGHASEHWEEDAQAARLVAGALMHDHA